MPKVQSQEGGQAHPCTLTKLNQTNKYFASFMACLNMLKSNSVEKVQKNTWKYAAKSHVDFKANCKV